MKSSSSRDFERPLEKSPSKEEVARRRDETIKRMLATPPKPHAPLKAKKKRTKNNGDGPKPASAARSKSKQEKK